MAKRDNGKGTLRKRSDGRWEGRYKIVDELGCPKTKYILGKTKAECQDKLEAFIKEYEESQKKLNRCPYLLNGEPTFKEWVGIWLENFCKGCIKDYTYSGYKTYMNKYLIPRIGELELKKISTVVCQQVIMDLYKNGRLRKTKDNKKSLAPKTISGIKIAFQSCMQKAVDEGLISTNPVKKVKLPKGEKKEMKTIKATDLRKFLEETKRSGWYEFYFLELSTGLRLGEILALTWDDLDIVNRTINVDKQVQRIDGKLRVNAPKTDTSIRKIKISQDCVEILQNYRRRMPVGVSIMFPSPVTSSYLDPQNISRALHRIQKRAGVEQIRFHDLRHSFATLSLEQGMDIKTVSNMLGHTDAGFTMNTYMHVTDNMQDTVANTMGELLSNAPMPEEKIIHIGA